MGAKLSLYNLTPEQSSLQRPTTVFGSRWSVDPLTTSKLYGSTSAHMKERYIQNRQTILERLEHFLTHMSSSVIVICVLNYILLYKRLMNKSTCIWGWVMTCNDARTTSSEVKV